MVTDQWPIPSRAWYYWWCLRSSNGAVIHLWVTVLCWYRCVVFAQVRVETLILHYSFSNLDFCTSKLYLLLFIKLVVLPKVIPGLLYLFDKGVFVGIFPSFCIDFCHDFEDVDTYLGIVMTTTTHTCG